MPVFLNPRQRTGTPFAVVELYSDYAVVQRQVDGLSRTVLVVLGLSLLALYLILLPIARRVAHRLEDQAGALETLLEQEQRSQAERRRLLDRTLKGGDEERARIAAELHDGPVQSLSRLGYNLELALLHQDEGDGEAATQLVRAVQESLFGEVADLRDMMTRLRPPVLDERGLEDAIKDRAQAIREQSGVACAVQAELDGRLAPTLETVLYRVSQEALANVVKHAGARHALVSLQRSNGSVVLEVRDDGVGFEPEHHEGGRDHFGLMAMRERVEMAGGRWEITSRPGKGTRIRAVLPWEEAQR